uniref:Uncharacterized protein n=1 Tax=Dasyclonium flaccidum TaxID=2007274 RepID=A0A1Z1MKJ4_9FLOR|nr:hypothetical protein [Dasyclonium flaccidum]ARW66607.1 hypothetical protein [Dasyclonium flaccidum]
MPWKIWPIILKIKNIVSQLYIPILIISTIRQFYFFIASY